MSSAEELMQRLAVSKKIMDRQSTIKRGEMPQNINAAPMLESFNTPQATYNLPQEFLSESPSTSQKSNYDPTKPIEESKILNSKLPDEIKKLMIERPIVQPNTMSSASISDDIIEGAQRLMKMENKNSQPSDSLPKSNTKKTTQNTQSQFNMNEMKTMIRDVVRDVVRDVIREELQDAGVISESSEDANESIQFKVGKHIFLGRVTKIQKVK
jgi:hypothetical protein